jgi:dihydrofolate reductase
LVKGLRIIKIVVAMDKNGTIGVGDKLPWHIPEDLKRFKALTMGKKCVMGSKTYESMRPYFKGEILPGREKFVLSRDKTKEYADALTVDYDDVIELAKHDDIYVIGGGEVYNLFFDIAKEIHSTHVETEVRCSDDQRVTFISPNIQHILKQQFTVENHYVTTHNDVHVLFKVWRR